jgi:hypothetical protein
MFCPLTTYECGHALSKLDFLVQDPLEFIFNKPNEELIVEELIVADSEVVVEDGEQKESEVVVEDGEQKESEEVVQDGEQKESEEVVQDGDDFDDEEDDLWRYDKNDNDNDADVVVEEEAGNVPGADCQLDFGFIRDNVAFFPGSIKSGRRASVHQSLHIDNKDLLFSSFMEAVLAGKHHSLTPLQWMSAGYVIDMPLSKEGGYLRVAVPNPAKERFELNWLHIPFGSFVVRNNALFHSGHYGSPGNTRFQDKCG